MSPQETTHYEAHEELASARARYRSVIEAERERPGSVGDLAFGNAVEADRMATIRFAEVAGALGFVGAKDVLSGAGNEVQGQELDLGNEQPIAA